MSIRVVNLSSSEFITAAGSDWRKLVEPPKSSGRSNDAPPSRRTEPTRELYSSGNVFPLLCMYVYVYAIGLHRMTTLGEIVAVVFGDRDELRDS